MMARAKSANGKVTLVNTVLYIVCIEGSCELVSQQCQSHGALSTPSEHLLLSRLGEQGRAFQGVDPLISR